MSVKARTRVTLSLSAEMVRTLEAKFGPEAAGEKGAEARRWLRLGFKMAEAGGGVLVGDRVNAAVEVLRADEETFNAILEEFRKSIVRKRQSANSVKGKSRFV